MRRHTLACFLAFLGLALSASAQRLPDVATPEHYSLKLTPDFQTDKFSGNEVIDVRLQKPTTVITLNAVDISFDRVSVVAGGSTQAVQVAMNADQEIATLTVANPVPAGAAQLKISYTGVLNDKLRGFYLSKANGRKYAVTQFEPTDARRAFPSFDEPAYKATFDIEVVVPKEDTAISNGSIVSDVPGPSAGQHTIKFATTPKMSTYLVAFLVGQFDCLNGASDGIPVRVCAIPGKQQYGTFALQWAQNILHFYDEYYGIKYPFGKLDLIAIPDFEAGAMENTAAITYREEALLVDPKTSTPDHEKNVALVIAHEMAHQWFGDLVTMAWWNDIWLNEGFATWMETKPVAALKPDWGIRQDEKLSDLEAMRVDSLESTRAIRTNAETSSQINELFDAIAYNKTAAVLRMIESYVKPEVFRGGVNQYLKAHAYANATAEDFWGKLTQVSGKPVDHIMRSYVDQPGIPIVTVASACTNGESSVSQQRFYYARKQAAQSSDEVWTIPLCMRDANAGPEAPASCTLVTQHEQKISTPGCKPYANQNVGGEGYYRSGYTLEESSAIASNFERSLSPVERLATLENEWALVRTGDHPIRAFMDMARDASKDRTHGVWDDLRGHLTAIAEDLVTSNDRSEYQDFARKVAQPAIEQLGWSSRPNDTYEERSVRASAFYVLGYLGRDQQAANQARRIVDTFIKNPASADLMLVSPALHIAAAQGNTALYDRLLTAMKNAQAPDVYYRYLIALTEFTDPALLRRTLDLALSPVVRSQDTPIVFANAFQNPASRELAWDFVRTHWTGITQKSSIWGGASVVRSTAAFCDPESRKQVQEFFTTHPVPAAKRTLRQTLEQIDSCVAFKSAQQPSLAGWLSSTLSAGAK